MHVIKAVFFDLDGTLINSLPDLSAAANALRASHGLSPLPRETIRSFIGDGVIALASRAITGQHDFSLPTEKIRQYRQEFIAYYSEHLTDLTELFNGVKETLAGLKSRGMHIVLITNKGEQGAKALLGHFAIASYFDAIYGGDSCARCKPDPMPLNDAMTKLNLAPENVLMVGDSANDILAGKAAGCQTALVNFGYGDVQPLTQIPATKPDIVISHLSEILAL